MVRARALRSGQQIGRGPENARQVEHRAQAYEPWPPPTLVAPRSLQPGLILSCSIGLHAAALAFLVP